MQASEGVAHASSIGTIIQDPQRTAALYSYTGADQTATPAFYFPVTIVPGNAFETSPVMENGANAGHSKTATD